MAEDGYPVKLHVYDLSQGMARQLSATILGKAIEAIWHTGVVVYGREYYFGGGIQQGQPGRTPYGTPVRVENLGVTHVPREVFEDFLREIGPRYTPATYNLLSHNCNNFSNEAAQFLAGAGIPSYILELPSEVMSSPLGALILPMIQGLETSLRAGAVPQPPQFTPAPAAAMARTLSSDVKPKLADDDKLEADKTRSADADKPEADKTARNGNGSMVPPPPPVQAAPAPAASQVPVTQGLETSSRAGAVPQPPQVIPAPVAAAVVPTSSSDAEPRSAAAGEPEVDKTVGDNGNGSTVPPAVQPAAAQASVAKVVASAQDPLTEAKTRAQEEIKREFAAIMATGAARAGEAAALATRRVMERHGLRRAATAMQRG
ncbi:hypothetical protein ACP70R_019249 [Stipagrostis hirtigluma subsp. patula]